jgi:hypothetical protein
MIDYNTIIRQVQIDLITEASNEMLDWFNEFWDLLEVVETNVYHKDGGEVIYYYSSSKANKQPIFLIDIRFHVLWCNTLFWRCIENHIKKANNEKCNSEIIQDTIKLILENKLNTTLPIPDYRNNHRHATTQDALNKIFKSIPHD